MSHGETDQPDGQVTSATGVVIVVAAGRGERMGTKSGIPKQYMPLLGKPILWHSLNRFEENDSIRGIILVIRPEDRLLCDHVLAASSLSKLRSVVDGGAERSDSVRAGLSASSDSDDILLVHDAARPFVSDALITALVDAGALHGAVIPAIPATDTIKEVGDDGRILGTPDRRRLWCAQTPQAFRRDLLVEAIEALGDGEEEVTDEASMLERAGHTVRILDGEPGNIKVTTEGDLERLEWLMGQERGGAPVTRERRVGIGYDVHALAAGRKLILGGVEIDFDRGLAGHSDADVLTHAIIDALLGAAGLGDIGRLFPDSDPQYKDVSSLLLLANVRARLVEIAAAIVNIDAVVMAESPKMAPHICEIESSLAATLDIDSANISVKATTTERLGFVGRGEGIAAQAICLVDLAAAD